MTRRTAARAAWSLWGLSLALAAGGVLVGAYGGVYSHSAHIPAVLDDLHSSVGSDLAFVLWILVFTTMGALVAARRWRNPVGWLLLAEGLVWDVQLLAQGYAAAALFTHPGTLPAGRLVLWVMEWWLYIVANLLLIFLVLLLPTGRLRSRRWRWAAWLGACCVALIVPSLLARRPLHPELPAITNPVGLLPPSPLVDLLDHLGEDVLLPLLGVTAAASLVLRFRTARGVERQQLKWLAYAAVLLLALGLGGTYLAQWLRASAHVVSFFQVAPLGAIPIAIAVAMLRHRLYDIDRIINRTLVYGLLTATLGLAYAGVVLLLGQLFGGVREQPPSWAIAGATLAVAALFQPLRRIQNGVDRRFNRRKYDAAKTIEAFSARLRQQIDLDTLSAELVAVVNQTMEPTTASLWLRPSAQPSKGQAAWAR